MMSCSSCVRTQYDVVLYLPQGPPSGATRPRDCEMDTSRLETMGIGQRTPVAEALAVVLRSAGAIAGATESA